MSKKNHYQKKEEPKQIHIEDALKEQELIPAEMPEVIPEPVKTLPVESFPGKKAPGLVAVIKTVGNVEHKMNVAANQLESLLKDKRFRKA
jgi:hypothetical protein